MENQSMVAIQEDLCNWEFINRFDFEIVGGGFEGDDDTIYELVESIDSLSSTSSSDTEEGPTIDTTIAVDGDVVLDVTGCARISDLGENENHPHLDLSNSVDDSHGYVAHQHHDDDVHDDDDEDERDDDGYDIDDELVPWDVKDRFVRQRIRKSGKNSFGKMAKSSKKSALVFTRPGCVRGKHGLGLKVY